MLESVKIARRQSEIRQSLAELAGKPEPDENEVRSMDKLDGEYRTNETRYRAALIAEDTERRSAGDELETRGAQEWLDLMGRYELRQAVLALDEGRALTGATAEIVQELRSSGGYRGVPVPWAALEVRAGETIAANVPNPVSTRSIIDRLFAPSVAARMGAQMIAIESGEVEYPVATSGAVVSWQATETGNVGGPAAYATVERPLKPDHTLGVQMRLTRKALKQTGAALEAAVRRDMSAAMLQEMDRVVFQGLGTDGEPLGVVYGADTYGITETPIGDAPTWGIFRAAVVRFMTRNAVSAPSQIRVLARPEVWDDLDAQAASTAAPMWEWDRLLSAIGSGNVSLSSNALEDPALASPVASKVLLTTTAGGVSPIFVGAWGAIDMIRDPYSDAQSGGLRVTALATMDVTISRTAQLEVLTGIERFVPEVGGG
jgi:HK97 family phage major capsid protein